MNAERKRKRVVRLSRVTRHTSLQGIVITGTDTGVGKTVVAAALARWLLLQGQDVGVMKPVETGWSAGPPSHSDAARLKFASQSPDPLATICPYRLSAPLSPYDAARRSDTDISIPQLVSRVRSLQRRHGLMLVEGAGGVLVPLTRKALMIDLIGALKLPVILVGRVGLGGINHALLTLESLRARQISVKALVLNRPCPPRSSVAIRQEQATLRSLRERAGVPVLGPLRLYARLESAWDRTMALVAKDPAIQALGRLMLTSAGRRAQQHPAHRARPRQPK